MVKKSPLFIRVMLFVVSFTLFCGPVAGMVGGLIIGKDFHIAYLIGIFFSGIIGFYALRMSLWNSFGAEVIEFKNGRLTYLADYKWFVDGRQTLTFETLNLRAEPSGYEDEKKGNLIFGGEDAEIRSVIRLPIHEIEALISIVKSAVNDA